MHEDVGFFSFDTARRLMVLRQFHVEGFVNQYVADPAPPPGRIVFTTEAIENIPAGFRAQKPTPPSALTSSKRFSSSHRPARRSSSIRARG